MLSLVWPLRFVLIQVATSRTQSMSLAVKYAAIWAGNSRMLTAKMIGITPAIVTLSGRYWVWAWSMRRPRTRLAYWTGMRRCPSLMKTTAAMTMIASTTNGMSRASASGPLTMGPICCGMEPTMPAKMMKLISERGLGNGISFIIFAGIVGSIPQQIGPIVSGPDALARLIPFVVLAIIVIAAVVFINEGQRRIPVQYASRVRGRRMLQAQTQYLPLKVTMAGVI